jgi:hypothetical protein
LGGHISYAFDEDLGYLFTIFQEKTFNLLFRGWAAGAGQGAQCVVQIICLQHFICNHVTALTVNSVE